MLSTQSHHSISWVGTALHQIRIKCFHGYHTAEGSPAFIFGSNMKIHTKSTIGETVLHVLSTSTLPSQERKIESHDVPGPWDTGPCYHIWSSPFVAGGLSGHIQYSHFQDEERMNAVAACCPSNVSFSIFYFHGREKEASAVRNLWIYDLSP